MLRASIRAFFCSASDMKQVKQVWDVDAACDEMKELLRNESALPKINEFLECGKSAFVIQETRQGVAGEADKLFVTYQLADELKVLLATVRAGNVDAQVA